MFLHYVGKHEHEPRKMCLFGHAVNAVCLDNDTASACYIFDIHELILIIL